MKRLLNLYHRTPPGLWSLFSSAQAYRLKKRRYGTIYNSALSGIAERTYFDKSQWRQYQDIEIANLLTQASKFIPAYKNYPSPLPSKSTQPLQVLSDWPVIDMDHFRHNPHRYCDPRYGKKNIVNLYTSGSTGTPKTIVRDSRAEQLNYAYFEARWRNNAGVKLGDRWVMIGGQLVVPAERKQPPFWTAAYPLKQLYMSSYHLEPAFAKSYMKAISRWKPVYILGYASSLLAIAQFAEDTNIIPPVKCILSNAEPLYDHIRDKLQRVFNCKVYDTYGATEGAFLGFECKEGKMHISPDFGVFEILRDDGTPCGPGEQGRAIVTGLTNRAMPLIRYPTGDIVSWAENQKCSCGCSFPILDKIEGRIDDLIELPNGRKIGRLDTIFKSNLPIREAQIIQRKDMTIDILVVPNNYHEESPENVNPEYISIRNNLLSELSLRLGNDIPIRVSFVEQIARNASNKFRAILRER